MDNTLQQQLTALKAQGLSAQQAVVQLRSTVPQVELMAVGSSSSSGGSASSGGIVSSRLLGVALTSVYELTPLDLAQLAKLYNDDPGYVAAAVAAGFPNLTALNVGELLLDPTLYPNLSQQEMYSSLITAGFNTVDVTNAVNAIYHVTYALSLSSANSFLSAPSNNIYNFGTGDFSLQCWVRTTTSGTVISRKPADGGYNNGGFLLVIKNDGTIKLATDNGWGFYEINTSATTIRNGNWHFLSAVRQNSALTIYLDGTVVPSAPRSNIAPPIDVNNNLPLYIGSVAQWQEPFQQFAGQLDEVRIWNRALSQAEIQANMNQPLAGNEPGLIGYYTFAEQNGNDSSPSHNTAFPVGTVTYVTPGAFG